MKINYEQTYVPYVDITIIMKAVYNEDNEQISYTLTGYYFGKPNIDGLETFKDSLESSFVPPNVKDFFKRKDD